MTQGFYEQLGVASDADPQTVRKAYHRQVARLAKRTRQLREQGGDTAQIELAREQLDEAWEVLSVPSRRQRYDVMLHFLEGDVEQTVDAKGLWERVGSELVPPAVAAATRLVARTTRLKVVPIGADDAPPVEPAPAREDPPTAATMVPATSVSDAPTDASVSTEPPPPVVLARPTPVVKLAKEDPPLRVVDGSPRASSVIVLPADAPRQKTLTGDAVARLVDVHGYTGRLLQAVREAKGVTLQEVAESTRISVRYLQAIEADAHERLPSATFVRGYVREIARLLKLDDEAVVAGYMRRLNG